MVFLNHLHLIHSSHWFSSFFFIPFFFLLLWLDNFEVPVFNHMESFFCLLKSDVIAFHCISFSFDSLCSSTPPFLFGSFLTISISWLNFFYLCIALPISWLVFLLVALWVSLKYLFWILYQLSHRSPYLDSIIGRLLRFFCGVMNLGFFIRIP